MDDRYLGKTQITEHIPGIGGALERVAEGDAVADIAVRGRDIGIGRAGAHKGDARLLQDRHQTECLAGTGTARDGDDCLVGSKFVADVCSLRAVAGAVFSHQFEHEAFQSTGRVEVIDGQFGALADVQAERGNRTGQGKGTTYADHPARFDDDLAAHIGRRLFHRSLTVGSHFGRRCRGTSDQHKCCDEEKTKKGNSFWHSSLLGYTAYCMSVLCSIAESSGLAAFLARVLKKDTLRALCSLGQTGFLTIVLPLYRLCGPFSLYTRICGLVLRAKFKDPT